MTQATLALAASFGTGIFALVAAIFWFWSAAMRLPPVTVRLFQNGKPGGPTPRQLAEKQQSNLSAIAALFSGLAALAQVAAVWFTPIAP